MTVELTPLGIACQLTCTYCYQHPMRDAGNVNAGEYDMGAMRRALTELDQPFTIFGGEPLMVPIKDLEELFALGLERHLARLARGQQPYTSPNGIQTNAALITEDHLRLFQTYQVHVGVSIDGPDELNDARWAGSLEKTREATAKSHWALEQMLSRGIGASLIVTLHRTNAGTPEKRQRLKAWLRSLDALGLSTARLHNLEVDHPAVGKNLELTQLENIQLFLEMADFESQLTRLRFDVFKDMEKSLLGQDHDVTCTWKPCDPYTTSAVMGLDGFGNKSNCGRTNKDGVSWLKADQASRERQFALYNTPQYQGGCQGCRFFLQCKGQCPGTAIDGDWRNKSQDCQFWMALLEHQERKLIAQGQKPLSQSLDRVTREMRYLEGLWEGQVDADTPHGDEHGDHYDYGPGGAHGDAPHGDAPHGDHSDHAGVAYLPVKESNAAA